MSRKFGEESEEGGRCEVRREIGEYVRREMRGKVKEGRWGRRWWR